MRLAMLAAWCALLTACRTVEPTPDTSTASTQSGTAELRPMPPGLDAAALDERADPCEDFYQYACGGWMQAVKIPAELPRWSRGFATIQQRNMEVLRAVLEEAVAGRLPPETPFPKKLADFYGACMDEPQLEEGLHTLQAELHSLEAVKGPRELAVALGQLHTQRVFALFTLRAAEDLKDVTQVLVDLDQGGLGLPDRDYYLKDDEQTRKVRQAYAEHLRTLFSLLGDAPEVAQRKAASVLALETALAGASLTRVERRDPDKQYHRMERKGLEALAPSFPWAVYFQQAGAGAVASLNITHPPFFQKVDALVRETKAADWQAYLTVHLVRSVVQALPLRFQEESFRFDGQVLTGARTDLPRWRRCVEQTDTALGEALAQPYLARTFGEDSKALTRQMVVELEKAFERNLESLKWMDEATREQARHKVRKLVNKVGYPDRWRSYEGLEVDRASFLRSLLASRAFEQARQMARVGKPVDRGEWLMTPPTVNAYYHAAYNEIVFAAGILQPPFFNRQATVPVNFGAMGMVVGHEITHGFDDEGRKFDADGNLRTWWTEASDEAFRERVACVEEQYDGYTAVGELQLNGALTLGENVADLGGLKLAYLALEAWLAREPEAARAVSQYRFTPAQQFFLGHAQTWCSKARDEYVRQMALTDPHSPPYWRVNGPLSNLPSFREAFQCKEGAKMARPAAQRCEVW